MRATSFFAWLASLLVFSSVNNAGAWPPGEVTVQVDGSPAVALQQPKFSTGFRKVSWTAKADANTPMLFILREQNSTNYAKGVETWLAVTHLESIQYDAKAQSVSVKVAGLKTPLTGTTQFKGLNVLVLESGKERYSSLGGKDRLLRGVQFGEPAPAPQPKGTRWKIQIDHPKASDPSLVVFNLKGFYQSAGQDELVSELPTRKEKAIPLALDQFKKLEVVAVESARGVAVELTYFNDSERTAVIPTHNGKKQLVGLLGEVPGGYQFFPWHTIKRLEQVKD